MDLTKLKNQWNRQKNYFLHWGFAIVCLNAILFLNFHYKLIVPSNGVFYDCLFGDMKDDIRALLFWVLLVCMSVYYTMSFCLKQLSKVTQHNQNN